MKGRLGSGRQLEETTLHEPGTTVSSGGSVPISGDPTSSTTTTSTTNTGSTTPGGIDLLTGLFVGTGDGVRERTRLNAPATSSLNLYGKLEGWGINPGSKVYDLKLSVDQLTGAQLQELLKKLPDGVTYSLDLEKD